MKYFILTLKHKWFVLLAGLRVRKIPLWRLIIHDWSKFTKYELPHYERQFFGDKGDPEGFAKAWRFRGREWLFGNAGDIRPRNGCGLAGGIEGIYGRMEHGRLVQCECRQHKTTSGFLENTSGDF